MSPIESLASFQTLFFGEIGEAAFFAGDDTEVSRAYAAHTGTTVERRGQTAEVAMTMFLSGWSQRRIADQLHLSRNTIGAILERWRRDGRLEPLKKRLSATLGRAVELGVEAWTDALAAGLVKPETIPIAVGIFSDKKALLDGEPTVRVDNGTREPTVEDVRRMLAELPAAQVVEVVEVPETAPKAGPKDYPVDYAADPATQPTDKEGDTHESK